MAKIVIIDNGHDRKNIMKRIVELSEKDKEGLGIIDISELEKLPSKNINIMTDSINRDSKDFYSQNVNIGGYQGHVKQKRKPKK